MVVHGGADLLGGLGLPENAQKAGVVALLDARGANELYGLVAFQTPGKSYLAVVPAASISPTAGGGEMKPLWRSDKLPGNILDMALGADPRPDKKGSGIYVLCAVGETSKERQVVFLELD